MDTTKILIVDDNEHNLYLLRVLLEKHSYKVTSATNGAEALESAHKDQPDIIISDILMPTMDGFSLCRRWRRDARLKEIPFIFYTATYTEPQDQELGISLGADRYIIKPAEPDVFLGILLEVIEGYQKGHLAVHHETLEEETIYLKQYNAALIRKLEDKLVELENVNLALEHDITERKRAEKALRESEEQHRVMAEAASDVIITIDQDSRVLFVNPAVEKLFGYRVDEVMGQSITMLMPERLGHAHRTSIERYIETGKRHITWDGTEFNGLHKNGEEIPLELSFGEFIKNDRQCFTGIIRGIAKRKRAEEELRASEKRFAVAFQSSPAALSINTLNDDCFLAVNDQFLRATGYTREELIGHTLLELKMWAGPEERDRAMETLKRWGSLHDLETTFPTKDGEQRSALFSMEIIELGGQECVLFATTDITERKSAEESMRKSAKEISDLYNNAPCGYYSLDKDDTFIRINDTGLNWLGYVREEVVGKLNIKDVVTSESLQFHQKNLLQLKQHGYLHDVELEMVRKDGTIMPALLSTTAVKDGDGNFLMSNSTLFDITKRKMLEEQLWQSQKMEAVGRLAGGIAHDFNNLLTAILGYSELLLAATSRSDQTYGMATEIRLASERAAALTRQLLAFSRKQVLRPKIINLNDIVANIDKMLRRLIGEDIDLLTIPDPTIEFVKADPGQIEQVIVNLVVNARDAMPHGGRLTIETANVYLDEEYTRNHTAVVPGQYVAIIVSDTGCGMDAEIQSHIFEPFFTTKEEGKGTGLGLSTVYGIVKQSGGHIWVYSEPGHGSSFKVYLPRIKEAPDYLPTDSSFKALARGTETVLLVEDEPAVRQLVATVLLEAGYTILEAPDGKEALRLVTENKEQNIALIVTDVIMPNMGGKELAEQIKAVRPDVGLLFLSGYTDSKITPLLEADSTFLQKPFTANELTQKVREIIDEQKKKNDEKSGSLKA